MNLNQLEYFINVAETLNFTKAAKRCFISQTAMTQQIHALEEAVGVPLFIRDKHHVELTAAGRVYLSEAREILEKSTEAMRLARIASAGVEGHIRIGYIRGYGNTELPKILGNFHHSYPNITFSLISENMSVLYQMLEKNECDVIFTIMSRQQMHDGIQHRYIDSFPLMAVLPAGHPLGRKKHLTYSDLAGEKFIMMQPNGRAKDEMEESMLVYERGGFFPDIVALEGNPETLLLMISVGIGISILPEYIIKIHQKRSDLVILPVLKADGGAETLDILIAWPLNNPNPAVEQLLSIIGEK